MSYTRRKILATAVTGAVGATGCLRGEGTTNDSGFVAQASFPVIHDFAENVVPDGAEVGNLVPIGQHGHGWEPSPDVQRAVTSADAFVYVFEGFQPWADDMVANVRRDHPDVAIVRAGEGVDMLGVGEDGHGHDEHEENDEHHEEEDGHDSHHEEEEHDHHEKEDEHDHDEEGDGHDDHDDDGDHDHDHDGDVDPHFWLDPLRAKTAVENFADGLAEAHGAEGYDENADAYKTRLDELHKEFESSLSDASLDTVLVAGHNAFRYLGARYGFRVETLTGISPDEQPSARDIERAQSLIDHEGVEYVLHPVFESDTAARTIVEDTSAQEVLPVTAFPAFRQDWLDDGWGYVEVMRNVNLSSLERALEA